MLKNDSITFEKLENTHKTSCTPFLIDITTPDVELSENTENLFWDLIKGNTA